MTILFDSIPGADPERHPVVRFRAIAYEGGPPPGFLPEWQEVERLDLLAVYQDGPPGEAKMPPGSIVLPARDALGAIDGLFNRHKRFHRKRLVRQIACVDSVGEQWRQVRALYRMFDKKCPWRLRRLGVPDWAKEEVRLERRHR